LLFYYDVVRNNAKWKNMKYLESNLSKCHFVRHKSHMELPGFEPRPECY